MHRLLTVFGAALLLSSSLSAQATPATGADSARRFVQEFYSWYIPMANKPTNGATWMRAIRQRGPSFTKQIIAALREDSVAAAKEPNEVVGLDGDPFLNAQEYCKQYRATRATASGPNYLVDVVGGGGDCPAHTKPDIIVELTRREGRWVFLNFRYPDQNPGDLLGLLQLLKKDRKKSETR
jgi:hypothetical protein